MKKQIYSLFVFSFLMLAATALPAFAQGTRSITATIPFNFLAGNKEMPAGEYTFVAQGAGITEIIKLRKTGGKSTAVVRARPGQTGSSEGAGKLIFYRYGHNYFLSQVFGVGNSPSYTVPRSKMQDRLAKAGSKQDVVAIDVR